VGQSGHEPAPQRQRRPTRMRRTNGGACCWSTPIRRRRNRSGNCERPPTGYRRNWTCCAVSGEWILAATNALNAAMAAATPYLVGRGCSAPGAGTVYSYRLLRKARRDQAYQRVGAPQHRGVQRRKHRWPVWIRTKTFIEFLVIGVCRAAAHAAGDRPAPPTAPCHRAAGVSVPVYQRDRATRLQRLA
jgi:hypothetical protein